MGNQYFFHKTTWQLIRTPAASAQVLDTVALGRPFENPAEAEAALLRAKGWLLEPLREPYRAPGDTPMVAFAKEEGCCDVIRSRYRVGEVTVETAQTRYLLSLRFAGLPHGNGNPVDRAAAVANQVLAMAESARFETLATDGGYTFGKQSSQRKRIDPDWPQWLDSLGWWTKDEEVGFVFIKSLGGPTREVIGADETMNAAWFHRGP